MSSSAIRQSKQSQSQPQVDTVRSLGNYHRTSPISSRRTLEKPMTPRRSIKPRDPAAVILKANATATASHAFKGASRCIAMAADRVAWTGESDGTISIRVAPLGYEVNKIPAFQHSIVQALLRVGSTMWAGYSDGIIRVFDTKTLVTLHQLTEHTAAIYSMTRVGDYVYTGGADWKVYQWDACEYTYGRLFFGHSNAVRAIVGVQDPETSRTAIFSASDDGTVKVWDPNAPLQTKKNVACVDTLEHDGKSVLSLLIVEGTKELWAGCSDGKIVVWSIDTCKRINTLTAHKAPVVSLSQVQKSVWSGSKDSAIFVWDVDTHVAVDRIVRGGAVSSPRYLSSIQSVFRSIHYHVWATAADGSWQCWTVDYPALSTLSTADDEPMPLFHEVIVPNCVSTVNDPDPKARRLSRPSTARAGKTPKPSNKKSKSRKSLSQEAPEDDASTQRAVSLKAQDDLLRSEVRAIRKNVAKVIADDEEGIVVLNDTMEDDAEFDVTTDQVQKSIQRERKQMMEDGEDEEEDQSVNWGNDDLYVQQGDEIKRIPVPNTVVEVQVRESKSRPDANVAKLAKALENAEMQNQKNHEELLHMGRDLVTAQEEFSKLAQQNADLERKVAELLALHESNSQ